MNEEHNKFTEVEMLLGGFFTLGVDGVCILIDITGIGAVFVAPVVQGFATFVLWLWFKNKGDPGAMKAGRQIVKYAANFLPITPIIITAFTTSIAFFIEVFIHNHPKLAAVAGKVGIQVAGAVLGGPAGAKIGAAAAQMAQKAGALKGALGAAGAPALSTAGAAEGGVLKKAATTARAARQIHTSGRAKEEPPEDEESLPEDIVFA